MVERCLILLQDTEIKWHYLDSLELVCISFAYTLRNCTKNFESILKLVKKKAQIYIFLTTPFGCRQLWKLIFLHPFSITARAQVSEKHNFDNNSL